MSLPAFIRRYCLLLTACLAAGLPLAVAPAPALASASQAQRASAPSPSDWPQLGHDAQRTNDSPVQVDPPYCYAWKWDEVPIASRAQPVVAGGRLFIGSMNGAMYARDAATGAPLWLYVTRGPIRDTAGVLGSTVIFSSYDGYTYAVDSASGSLAWKTPTGPSATAPLIDDAQNRVYVASTDGVLSALNGANGVVVWQYDAGAPILTSPSLSVDGSLVFIGSEAIQALAVRAATGQEIWRTTLKGMSLADRYPVVSGTSVIFRSQPVYFFHTLLHEGDSVMDQAGSVNSNWGTDWANVRSRIVSYLSADPSKSTFFVLNTGNGSSKGVAPVLYTYGNNDIPNVPVIRGSTAYVTYRARHGIQTDGGAVHVTSKYDAELGQMDLGTLDITGLRQANYPQYSTEFRMTSDEPAMLSMGGDILWVDNWERLGGLNVNTGALIHVGNVSNVWPECSAGTTCGPTGPKPFFPMTGSGQAYPFPSPRVTEGHQRGGVVIAENMLYWRVVEGGLAGISHQQGTACAAPKVWTSTPGTPSDGYKAPSGVTIQSRPLADYVTLDLTSPVANPPTDLVQHVREEVTAITSSGGHLMPFFLERGFSEPFVWPYNTTNPPGPPQISYNGNGDAFWHDPSELLYTLAAAYPYLDSTLQAQTKSYMAAEMGRYPPLKDLPWSGMPWLKQGVAREGYAVPFRASLNNWPPPAANLSALYSLWLWSKNTGDWSYAQARWSDATTLFNSRKGSMLYYADIAGAIGYARLAQHFGDAAAYQAGVQAAVAGMQAGLDFATFRDRAAGTYLDPRGLKTGWSAPVFFGLTPEVGLYLREQTAGAAQAYLLSLENGDGLRWWYLTRAGEHAETGETSFLAPYSAWAHYLAHAYILGDSQATLQSWLDWPWGDGDLYSIQKLVAAVQSGATGIPLPSATPTAGPSLTPTVGPSPTPAPTATPTPIFADVPVSHWAHDFIETLFRDGYVAGCNSNPPLYCPDRILTRAESAVFVLRGVYGSIASPPYPPPASPSFADVPSSFWGFGWIESLWKDAFTAGCGTNPLIFCPSQQHSRAEGSVFFLRIKNGAAYSPPAPAGLFADVPSSAWYAAWVEAAYNAGLLPACSSSPLKFCPDNLLDRAWAAYMMVKAKGISLTSGLPSPTPTVTDTLLPPTGSPTASPSPSPAPSSTPTPAPTLTPTSPPSPTDTPTDSPVPPSPTASLTPPPPSSTPTPTP